MSNLNDLFTRDTAFRSIVIEAAARAIGSTSEDFAEEWLMHESCAQYADQPEPAKVDGGESRDKFGAVTNFDAPKMDFDKYREIRIEYTESLADAYKSITVETYLTADELFRFVREVIRDDR